MKSYMRAANETAITREQHEALTADRTRPLSDRHMSNAGASRWRAEQSSSTVSALDQVIHDLETKAAK